jgi:signal transduction histidine kinase
MAGADDAAALRIAELEQLVRGLRHDINGALTPALMSADMLRSQQDQRIQRAGDRIEASIGRITRLLKSTRDVVAPSSMVAAVPDRGAAVPSAGASH